MPVEGAKQITVEPKDSNYHEIKKFSFSQSGNPMRANRHVYLNIELAHYDSERDELGELIRCDFVGTESILVEGADLLAIQSELTNGADNTYEHNKKILYSYLQSKGYVPAGSID